MSSRKHGPSLDPLQLAGRLQQTALSLGSLLLERKGPRVVFAESCTAGLVAASLAIVPGISRCLCGSLVTYREASKTAWLGVDTKLIAAVSAVSPEVTAAMACGALQRTTEASWAAAVTGHLGPDAPPDCDGCIYIAIARRRTIELPQSDFVETGLSENRGRGVEGIELVVELEQQLTSSSRLERQQQAAELVLATLEQALRSS